LKSVEDQIICNEIEINGFQMIEELFEGTFFFFSSSLLHNYQSVNHLKTKIDASRDEKRFTDLFQKIFSTTIIQKHVRDKLIWYDSSR
jgi:hypothetical protein